MEAFVRDVRFALRGLRRRPLFAVLAILTIALGIGANSTIFSVLYATILRPLPFPVPDRLARVSLVVPTTPQGPGRDDIVWSFPKYQTWAGMQQSFASHALYSDIMPVLATPDGSSRLEGEHVTGQYFRVLGVRPAIGRDFVAEGDRGPAARAVALLSYSLWDRQFSADPAVIDRVIQINGAPATVIGILPPGFRGLSGRADLWLNIARQSAGELEQRWSHQYTLVARLSDGVSMARAEREAGLLGPRVHEAHRSPREPAGEPPWGATLRPLDAIRFDPAMSRSVAALTAAVALVLLLACANLASLLLARATARTREISVRLAIGARRSSLIRQLLTESAVLAFLGAALGLGLAQLGVQSLSRLWEKSATAVGTGVSGLTHFGMSAIQLDNAVVLFTVALAVLTAFLIGLLPALQATRPNLTLGLKEGGAGTGPRRGWSTLGLRDSLVVGEIALAVVLLAGAGLMLRSLSGLVSVETGVDPKGVTTIRLAIPPGMPSADSSSAYYTTILQRVAAVPGVESVSIGNCPPLSGGCNGTIIWFRDRPEVPQGTEPPIGVQFVSPDWFATLGVRLVRGRLFTEADRPGTPKVILINEAAAKKFWPNEDPIGKPVGIGQGGFHDRVEVVGIVSDVRFGTAQDPQIEPDAYISYLQSPRGSAILFVRSRLGTNDIAPSVRAAIREVDRGIPVYDIRSLSERVRLATVRERFTGGVLTAFAAAALAIAGIGIYALIAWEIGRRTREIGIRMALGAEARSILALVVHRGVILLTLGLGIGLGLSFGLTRLMQAMLFGVEPTDPVTYVGLAIVLIVTGTAATLIPARRATRVNPVEAIRSE